MNLLDYVDCAFPYLAAFILTLYLGLFFYGLFTVKVIIKERKPIALYHFTSGSCLENIVSSKIAKSINYGVFFCTSNRKKSNRGQFTNPFETKGVVIFTSKSLDCFKANFQQGLLQLICLYKVFKIYNQEYITKSNGDLYLSQAERINNHMLLVREVAIKSLSKKTGIIRRLRLWINMFFNFSYSVIFLSAFLCTLALLKNTLEIKLYVIAVLSLYAILFVLLLLIFWALKKIETIK